VKPMSSLSRILVPSPGARRVAAYLACVSLLTALFAGRTLYADVREAAFAAGAELSNLSDLTGDSVSVAVNGARFHHASAVTRSSVSAVLDRVEAHCEDAPNTIGNALRDVPADQLARLMPPLPNRAIRSGVVRDEAEGRGMVACLVDGRPSSLSDLTAKIRRFVTTRDLSEFGKLRYTYAKTRPDGLTYVVTVWADDGLDLRKMFPATGDAAGADSDLLPRPPHARRTLSAAAEDRPYAAWVYEVDGRKDEVRTFYTSWMAAHGWQTVKVPDQPGALAFLSPAGQQAFLAIGEHGGRSVVSVTQTGFSGEEATLTVEVSP